MFFCCIRPLYSTTRQKRFFFNAARSLVTEERKPSVITRIECTYGTEILLSIVFMNVFLFIQYQVFDKLDLSDLLIFDLLTKNWSTVSSYGEKQLCGQAMPFMCMEVIQSPVLKKRDIT